MVLRWGVVFGWASISRKGSQWGWGNSIRFSLLPRRVELFFPRRATESPKYSGLGLSSMESIASLASFRCSSLSTSRTIRNPSQVEEVLLVVGHLLRLGADRARCVGVFGHGCFSRWIGLGFKIGVGGRFWQGAVPAAPAVPRRRVRRAWLVGAIAWGGSTGRRATVGWAMPASDARPWVPELGRRTLLRYRSKDLWLH